MSSKNQSAVLDKRERVTARLSSHVYRTISLAADILGSNINQFLIQSSFEKANSVIENERIIPLNSKDAELFFKHIDNPSKPNKKLRKALIKYKESGLYAQGGTA